MSPSLDEPELRQAMPKGLELTCGKREGVGDVGRGRNRLASRGRAEVKRVVVLHREQHVNEAMPDGSSYMASTT